VSEPGLKDERRMSEPGLVGGVLESLPTERCLNILLSTFILANPRLWGLNVVSIADRLCKILGPCIRSGEELDDDNDLLDELHGVCVSPDADESEPGLDGGVLESLPTESCLNILLLLSTFILANPRLWGLNVVLVLANCRGKDSCE